MSKFISRKVGAFLFTSLLAALNNKLGLDLSEDVILALVGLAGIFIFGQAWVDGKDKDAKSNAGAAPGSTL